MITIRLLGLIASFFELGHSQEFVDARIQFGKEYFVGDGSKSFADSKSFCASHGGQLVRIDSLEEEAFVKKLVRDKFGPSNVGMNAQKVKGSYVWPNGDQVRPITSWYPGYPSCKAECCRLILASTQGWLDYACQYHSHFACEIIEDRANSGPMNMNVPDFRNWTITGIENLKEGEESTVRIVNRLAQYNEKTSKYFLTDGVYNISSAKEFCELQNCHLAVVGSRWEEGLIGNINKDSKPWIGLERVNGTFKWLAKYDIEYANWNPAATLHTLEELLQMQTDVPVNLSQIERFGLLNRISEHFARYRNKWGVDIVACMAVFMESEGTWNVDRCAATRYGVCERRTWMESKTSQSIVEINDKLENSKAHVSALQSEFGLQKRLMENKIKGLESRLEEQESQKREMQQQIAQLVEDFNAIKEYAKND